MIRFLDGNGTTTELKKQIARSKMVRIAVAFWGEDAADDLGLLARGKAATVVCNLKSGGTNPEGIRPMIEAGVVVGQCDKLHGKVYLFDESVIIGSSNASANGLSLQGAEVSGWREANVVTDDKAVYASAESWFDKIEKKVITHDDLVAAQDAWSKRRHITATKFAKANAYSLVEAIKRNPDEFADRRLFLCFFSERMSANGEKALEIGRNNMARKERVLVDGFECWPELPDSADLISFAFGTRGGITFDGFWEMPEERKVSEYKGTQVVLCWKKEKISGISRLGSIADWKPALRQFKLENYPKGEGCIDLGKFAKKYLIT